MEKQPNNGIWKQVVTSLIVAACSASITFGYTASCVTARQSILEREFNLTVTSLREADTNTNHRIDRISELLELQVKQNTELITLLRLQQSVK